MAAPYVCKRCGKEMFSLTEVVEYWDDIYCKACNPEGMRVDAEPRGEQSQRSAPPIREIQLRGGRESILVSDVPQPYEGSMILLRESLVTQYFASQEGSPSSGLLYSQEVVLLATLAAGYARTTAESIAANPGSFRVERVNGRDVLSPPVDARWDVPCWKVFVMGRRR